MVSINSGLVFKHSDHKVAGKIIFETEAFNMKKIILFFLLAVSAHKLQAQQARTQMLIDAGWKVIVRPKGDAGKLSLMAKGEGLDAAQVVIETK